MNARYRLRAEATDALDSFMMGTLHMPPATFVASQIIHRGMCHNVYFKKGKFKDLRKFERFQGLENKPFKFKSFQGFQGPA